MIERHVDVWLMPKEGKTFRRAAMRLDNVLETSQQLQDNPDAKLVVEVETPDGQVDFEAEDIWVAQHRENSP